MNTAGGFFSVTWWQGGIEHKMDTLAENATDLHEPLARFGGYLRKKALKKYEQQSFAPLADSTLAKRAEKGLHSAERKLAKDVRRATSRAKARAGTKDDFIASHLAANARGVKNRLAVLAEFQNRHQRMFEGRRNGLVADKAGLKPLTVKQLASLDGRVKRAVEKAVNRPILGGLPRTLVVEVNHGTMALISRTHEEWSEAHNAGATVGHGATEPERRTLELTSTDRIVFENILKDHLLLPFTAGLQGPGY